MEWGKRFGIDKAERKIVDMHKLLAKVKINSDYTLLSNVKIK